MHLYTEFLSNGFYIGGACLAVLTLLSLAWPLALEPEPNHGTLVAYVSGVVLVGICWLVFALMIVARVLA